MNAQKKWTTAEGKSRYDRKINWWIREMGHEERAVLMTRLLV